MAFNISIHYRIALVCGFLALILTFYAFRLIEIQVGRHEEFSELAAEKHGLKKPIFAIRGNIVDRNGEPLAVNLPVRTIYADGTHITDPKAIAEIAAPFLHLKKEELAKKLDTKRPYLIIANGVSEMDASSMMETLEKANLRGLYIQPSSQRSYPNGKMLSHLLGFVDHTGHGISGIEHTLENILAGHDGYRHIEHDRKGLEIILYRSQEKPAQDGENVQLTIDMGLQAIVEQALDEAIKTYQPASATAIFADPNTGEILAMASRPTYDPNQYGSATPEELRNRIVTDVYEPGSTFKIVTASGALNEKTIGEKTEIFCENGHFLYGGKVLHDHGAGHGYLTVQDILACSSNIGAAKIALKMGDHKFYEYVRRFGFGEKTKIALPGEVSGIVNPPSRWDKLTITRMAMGQSIAVTPIQMLMAMAVIANGGNLLEPQIIQKIGSTSPTNTPKIVRPVISPTVAKKAAAMLSHVVSTKGTAAQAKVEGFTVAGKTGTAQKISPHGGYLKGRYIVSFAGFFPLENPKLVGIVIIDDAHNKNVANYGGLIAAPIFSQIASAAARYFDYPLENPLPSPTTSPTPAHQ